MIGGGEADAPRPFASELWQSVSAGPPAFDASVPAPLAEAVYLALQPARATRLPDAGALAAAWRGERVTAPTPHFTLGPTSFDEPAPVPPVHLPEERDSFVGREAELDRIEALVDTSWLATILGPGGVGKTRVGLRVARRIAWRFHGGVYGCELAGTIDRDGVLRTLAAALGVPLASGDAVAQVGHALACRSDVLVLLDNAEQVAEPLRVLLTTWRALAPAARFLVTSRIRLDLPGEAVHDLAPLPLPDERVRLTAAVQLFLDRARAARADIPLHLDEVGHLVARLDGLPLAIELAAARVRLLSVAGILSRLDDRFALLSGPRDRRATLRGSLDLSWELLDPAARDALAGLSVFVGSFTFEAAEHVVGPDALDRLQRLVDHSLLHRSGDRLRLLVTIREYASERLADRQAAEARHGAWYARLGEDEVVQGLLLAGGDARRQSLSFDAEDLLVACQRALARGDAPVAVGTFCAAWAAMQTRVPAGVMATLAEQIDAWPDLPPPLRARLCRDRCAVLGRAAQPAAVLAVAERGLAAAETVGDPRAIILASLTAERPARQLGRLDEARRHLDRALALSERDRGPARVAVLSSLALWSGDQGRPGAVEAATEATRIARRIGSSFLLCRSLNRLAMQHAGAGAFEPAAAAFAEADALALATGDLRDQVSIQYNRALLHEEHGRRTDAIRIAERALTSSRAIGERSMTTMILCILGGMYARTGALERAEQTLDEGAWLVEELSLERLSGLVEGNRAWIRKARGDLPGAADGLRVAATTCRTFGLARIEAALLVTLCEVLLDLGDLSEAAKVLEDCARHADTRILAHVRASSARLALARGDLPGALTALEEAETLAVRATAPRDGDTWGAIDRARAACVAAGPPAGTPREP